MQKNVKNEEKQYLKKGYRGFLPNNPGRPKGCLNKDTILKNTVLDALIKRKEEIENINILDLLKVGATFVPKEIKGDKTADNRLILYIAQNSKTGDNNKIQVHTPLKSTDD